MTVPAPRRAPNHAPLVSPLPSRQTGISDAALAIRIDRARHRDVSLPALGLYAVCLIDFGPDPGTWHAYASADRMAATVGRSGEQARRMLAELVRAGLLERRLVHVVVDGANLRRIRYVPPAEQTPR